MRFAADENFNNKILRGLLQRLPGLDLVRVQDTEMYAQADPIILNWCAQHNRILCSHDFRTIPAFAWARVASGLQMPGVVMVRQGVPFRIIVDQLSILIGAGYESDFTNKVLQVPFK